MALAGTLAILALVPAASQADTIWDSSLSGAANVIKKSPVDSVYWAAAFGNGSSPAAPAAGQVKSVTVKGRWISGPNKIFVQVLRPQLDGSVQVVATSQPFELPGSPGTYTFSPTNMFVQQGDYIGLATIGGEFEVAGSASGSATNDFSGHNQDMNGAIIRPTEVEKDVELLLQVDLVPNPTTTGGPGGVPKTTEKPPEKGKKKPCHCQKLTVKLDPTLLNKKKLRPDKHDFGVGFSWRLTCSGGTGSCIAYVHFLPPKVLAGSLPQSKKGPRLNLTTMTFKCGTHCKTSTVGRFEVKMKSRDQLNKLFGRTLAFSLILECPGGPSTMVSVKVFVDPKGVLRARR